MHSFLIVIEKAENNYSAYSPDLSGCVATGKTVEQVENNMHKTIECISKGCRKIIYQFLMLIRLLNMWQCKGSSKLITGVKND